MIMKNKKNVRTFGPQPGCVHVDLAHWKLFISESKVPLLLEPGEQTNNNNSNLDEHQATNIQHGLNNIQQQIFIKEEKTDCRELLSFSHKGA